MAGPWARASETGPPSASSRPSTPRSQFVTNYQPFGTTYGVNGLSEGAMPGFGANPNVTDPETAVLSP